MNVAETDSRIQYEVWLRGADSQGRADQFFARFDSLAEAEAKCHAWLGGEGYIVKHRWTDQREGLELA